jgi:hypothetical protein
MFGKLHRGVVLLALGFLSPAAHAAADLDPALIATPDCPSEPGCPALILRDEMQVNNQYSLASMSFRRAIKVFTPEGVARWSNVTATAIAGQFNIRNLGGRTILPGGRRVKLDQRNVQVKTALEMNSARVITKSALFPGVVPGAVIQYQYDLISEGAGDLVNFQWDIQAEVPVLESDLILKHGGVQFKWLQSGGEPVQIAEEHPFPNVLKLHASNVPAIPDEPLGPGPDAWRTRVFFHQPAIGGLWLGFYAASESLRLDRFAGGKSQPVADKLRLLRRQDDSQAQWVGAVYRFVQESIQPAVAPVVEVSLLKPSNDPDAGDVLATGSGNNLQRTMLFIALVRQGGLESALVAVAGRDQGVFDPLLPDTSQFNAYLAAVREENRWTFYDLATRHCPFRMVSPKLESTVPNAIIAMPGIGPAMKIVPIPVSSASRNLLSRDVSVTLQSDGSGLVEARDDGEGLVDLDHRDRYERLPEAERRQALEVWLHRTLPLARVEEATFENLESFTGKARILYRFTIPEMALESAGLLVINPSVLHGTQAVPFTAGTRRTPVDFGHAQRTVERIAFALPPGYAVRTLPQPVVVRDGPLSLITSCVVLEGQVVFTRRLEIDAATWAAEEYPRLKAFFEKVQDADRQSLVLAREGA